MAISGRRLPRGRYDEPTLLLVDIPRVDVLAYRQSMPYRAPGESLRTQEELWDAPQEECVLFECVLDLAQRMEREIRWPTFRELAHHDPRIPRPADFSRPFRVTLEWGVLWPESRPRETLSDDALLENSTLWRHLLTRPVALSLTKTPKADDQANAALIAQAAEPSEGSRPLCRRVLPCGGAESAHIRWTARDDHGGRTQSGSQKDSG